MESDDLRERIAKAIAGAVYGHNTRETAWADLHEDAQDEYLAEADAVIRELGSFVNENGVWGVIDLLTEIAGPRCFAEGIPNE